MGPTSGVKSEPRSAEFIEEVIIDSSYSDVPSSPSSLDEDTYSGDEVFTNFYAKSSNHSKENRPLQFSDDGASRDSLDNCSDGGGQLKVKVAPRSASGGDDSYLRRRQRNNAAVKRSRDKARQRQRESQRYLAELTAENRRLQMKADVLLKELSLLRGLFPAVGVASEGPRLLLQDVDAILAESSP